jgi:hypothetical protein
MPKRGDSLRLTLSLGQNTRILSSILLLSLWALYSCLREEYGALIGDDDGLGYKKSLIVKLMRVDLSRVGQFGAPSYPPGKCTSNPADFAQGGNG